MRNMFLYLMVSGVMFDRITLQASEREREKNYDSQQKIVMFTLTKWTNDV